MGQCRYSDVDIPVMVFQFKKKKEKNMAMTGEITSTR
jgi:hypothetical protein